MSKDVEIPLSLQNRLSHACFPQPEHRQVKVWRYMDLAKFIWLLREKKLFLSRLDKLSDQYEGSLTIRTILGISTFLKNHRSKTGWDELSKMYRQNRGTTFVCCWHANEHESEAMWRLYGRTGNGIAIQSTYQDLVHAISSEDDVYLGCVKYIDYEQDWFPSANIFYPVMHKRLAFSHEREVRLVSLRSAYQSLPEHEIPESISIPWDLDRIKGVYVDPYAPKYFFEAVTTVIQSMAPSLCSRVTWSSINAAPVF